MELKPCPFCGETPEIAGRKIREFFSGMWIDKELTQYYILPRCKSRCLFRQAFMSIVLHGAISDITYSTPERAIEAWNRRANDV